MSFHSNNYYYCGNCDDFIGIFCGDCSINNTLEVHKFESICSIGGNNFSKLCNICTNQNRLNKKNKLKIPQIKENPQIEENILKQEELLEEDIEEKLKRSIGIKCISCSLIYCNLESEICNRCENYFR
jgi:hypothetical protein